MKSFELLKIEGVNIQIILDMGYDDKKGYESIFITYDTLDFYQRKFNLILKPGSTVVLSLQLAAQLTKNEFINIICAEASKMKFHHLLDYTHDNIAVLKGKMQLFNPKVESIPFPELLPEFAKSIV